MSIFSSLFQFFGGSAPQDTIDQTMQQQMEEAQQQMEEAQREMEEQARLSDPYQNPGQDAIVDETYFGIDEGLGIANPEQDTADDLASDTSFDSLDDSSSFDSWDSGDDSWSSSDDSWDCGGSDSWDFGGGNDFF